jgi:hypothetical protein
MMSVRPTPRIANDAALKAVMRAAEKPGTVMAMPERSRATMRSMSAEVTAVTETGVCCRSVTPARVAVTSTSSRPLLACSCDQDTAGATPAAAASTAETMRAIGVPVERCE